MELYLAVTNVVTANDLDRHKQNLRDLLATATLSEPDLIKVNPAKRNRAKSLKLDCVLQEFPAKRNRAWLDCVLQDLAKLDCVLQGAGAVMLALAPLCSSRATVLQPQNPAK